MEDNVQFDRDELIQTLMRDVLRLQAQMKIVKDFFAALHEKKTGNKQSFLDMWDQATDEHVKSLVEDIPEVQQKRMSDLLNSLFDPKNGSEDAKG